MVNSTKNQFEKRPRSCAKASGDCWVKGNVAFSKVMLSKFGDICQTFRMKRLRRVFSQYKFENCRCIHSHCQSTALFGMSFSFNVETRFGVCFYIMHTTLETITLLHLYGRTNSN